MLRTFEELKLFWEMYQFGGILLFLCGSEDVWHTIYEMLMCGDPCGTAFWKSQNHNCAMSSVGATIVALMAITSLLLPFTSQVHWVTRAMWVVSLLSAFLSVLFACKHQSYLGNMMFLAQHDAAKHASLQVAEKASEEPAERAKKCLRAKDTKAKPDLSVVLLFSVSKAFFHYALASYIIGLGVYLGFLWQNNPDPNSGPFDNRNIFIVYLVYGGFCICVYFLPTYPKPYAWKKFEDYWRDFDVKVSDGSDKSKGASHNDPEKAMPTELLAGQGKAA